MSSLPHRFWQIKQLKFLVLFVLLTAVIPTTSALNNGIISGTVTNMGNQGIANIEVSVYYATGSGWNYHSYTNTDSNGSYTIGNLPIGTYRILFRDWSGTYAYEYYDSVATLEDGIDIAVDNNTTTIDATLKLAGRISGNITDPNGDSITNGAVAVFEDDPDQNLLFIQQIASGSSYDIGGFPTGQYIVRFTGQISNGNYYLEYYDNVTEWNEATPVSVTVGITTAGIDAVLGDDTDGAINGLVKNDQEQPLANIEVWLYRQQNGEWELETYTTTDSNGAYSFTEVPADTYRLFYKDWSQLYAYEYYNDAYAMSDATDIVVNGTAVQIEDVQLEVGGRISGTLTAPGGAPLENTFVFAFAAEPERGNVIYLTSAPNGTYEIGGLPTGNYVLQFTGDQDGYHYLEYFNDVAEYDEATPVPVRLGFTTSNVNAYLGVGPGGTVSGDITSIYGRSFDFARVFAYQFDGTDWVLAGSASTNYYDSTYDIPLAAGEYRLMFEAGSFANMDHPIQEYYDDVLTIEAGTTVTMGVDSEITNIDGVLGNYADGTIAGQVTDEAGAPVAGIEVYVYDRAYQPLYDQTAVTDTNGQYTLNGLWSEQYFIEFYDPQFNYAGEYYNDATLPQNATPILYTDTPITGIDASLTLSSGTNGGSISGQITAENSGQSLFGIRVTAYDSLGNYAATAYSNSIGEYRLRELLMGNYYLRFQAQDGEYVTEWYDDVLDMGAATAVTVNADSDTGNINAALTPAGSISGSMTNGYGQSFSYGIVSAYAFNGTDWEVAASDSLLNETEYLISGLPEDDYRIAFYGGYFTGNGESEFYDDASTIDAGIDVPVVAGQTTSGIDAVLGQAPTTGSISGSVLDNNNIPFDIATVTAYQNVAGNWLPTHSTNANASGNYEFANLLPGTYRLEFVTYRTVPFAVLTAFYGDVMTVDNATDIVVHDGEHVLDVDMMLTAVTLPSTLPSADTHQLFLPLIIAIP